MVRKFSTKTERQHREPQRISLYKVLYSVRFCCNKDAPLFVALLCALFVLFPAQPILAQSLPDLPQITFDNFETVIREQLRKAYNEAQSKPQDATVNGELGMALHAYNQYEFAAICFQRARQFAPKELRWHYYFGLAQAALAQHTDAIAAFKTALQLAPNDLPAQLRLAETFLGAGQYREAQSLYESLVKQKAISAQVQFGLGQSKIGLGDKTTGIEHLRQAISLFPEFGSAHYSLGLVLRSLGQKEEAQKHLTLSQQFKYQRPIFDDPLLEAIAAANASATEQLSRGVVLANMGNVAQSITAHERALELNSQLVQAHINLISLYAQIGKLDKAEAHYQAALSANPNLADSHFNYGVIQMEQGRLPEAAEAFKRSLERNPYSAESHYNYGIIIERDGKLDEAAAHYKQALENKPDHRMAHFHLGRILVNQDNLPAAIEHFRQTLTPIDQETPRLMYALGATYIRAGDRSKGIPYLREAIKKAQEFGQNDLATAIARDLQQLENSQ